MVLKLARAILRGMEKIHKTLDVKSPKSVGVEEKSKRRVEYKVKSRTEDNCPSTVNVRRYSSVLRL